MSLHMRNWFCFILLTHALCDVAKAQAFQRVGGQGASYKLNQSWVYIPPLTWDTSVQVVSDQDKPPAIAFFVSAPASTLFEALEHADWAQDQGTETFLRHVRLKGASAERIYQQVDSNQQTVWSVAFFALPREKNVRGASELWLAVTCVTSAGQELSQDTDDEATARLSEVLLDGEARVLSATAQDRDAVPFFDIRHTAFELRQWFETASQVQVADGALLCPVSLAVPRIEQIQRPVGETVFWHDDTTPNRVALTFDACSTFGHGDYNPMVIEVLKRYHVPATLFVGGHWAEMHPDTLRELAENPLFEIGNHSYSHPHMRDLPLSIQRQELLWTQQAIFERAGVWPRFFRPPYGEVDDAMITNTAEMGLETVEYDLPAGDAWLGVPLTRLIRWVVDQSVPGSIVIMHMNHPTGKTALALPKIIEGLRKRGFILSTIGQMRQEHGR